MRVTKRIYNLYCYNKFNWYESLPVNIPNSDKFIKELQEKYKSFSFDNFTELYVYLAINKPKELIKNDYKLLLSDDKFNFIKI